GRVASGTTGGTPGRVTSQEPAAGDTVDRSTPVFLGYDLASDVVAQVPALDGMFANTARVQLRRAGLTPGGIDYDEESGERAGTVLATVPPAGTYTLNGTPVKLIVSGEQGSVDLPAEAGDDRRDEPSGMFPEDELGGRDVPFTFDPASQGIPSLMEQRYELRLLVEDERGERTVLDRDMPGGEGIETRVTVYGDALLRMYINDVFFMAWRP
ncbi:MAG TPA: PASTA domain-containing protein, partial [Deinococcales bacterium]|nr:PASTA domain-containing protein [Deinococcales bacterium]